MKNKKIVIGMGVLALAVVGGTLAFFNQSTTINNPFSTTSFEGSTVEKFNPTDAGDWKPGATVDKTVVAQNTGDGDMWVRIKLQEQWAAANDNKEIDSANEQFLPTRDNANQLSKDDGLTAGDGSVVYKELDIEGWTLGADGYYYFNTTLEKDGKTTALLNSVTLCNDADMGLYEVTQYYAVVEKDAGQPAFDGDAWTEYEGELEDALKEVDTKGKDVYTNTVKKLNQEKKGYSSDQYTLSIITEFVQADKEAATASSWEMYPGKK